MPSRPRALVASAALGLAIASAAPARAQDAGDLHAQGVAAARAGQHDAGIGLLLRARAAAPDDRGILADLVVVFSWAGRDREALARFAELGEAAAPGYVLAAAAVSARRSGQPARAIDLYRLALQRGGDGRDLRYGIALAEAARGGRQAARQALNELLAQDPNDARARALLADLDRPPPLDLPAITARLRQLAAARDDVGLAALAMSASRGASPDAVASLADALLGMRRPYDALLVLTPALLATPNDLALRRQEILALERIGAAELARSRAATYPAALRPGEEQRLTSGASAFPIRWGEQIRDPAERLPEQRFARTDRAIAALDAAIAAWSAQGDAVAPHRRSARLDRVVALVNRARMTEAIAEAEALAAGGPLPAYVQAAIAQAYFSQRRVEDAEAAYRAAIAGDPNLIEARFGLFYALTEQRRWDDAQAVVADLDRLIPAWRAVRGAEAQAAGGQSEEWDRVAAERVAALWYQYGDDLAEAERRVDQLTERAPRNISLRAHRGDIWRLRLWPERALEEYDAALADTPDSLEIRLGRGHALLDLRRYREATAQVEELVREYPEDLAVQRLARRLRIWHMWELEAEATAGLGRGSPDGEFDLGMRFYSPPIDWNWRLFAGSTLRSGGTPSGYLTTFRLSAGVEWRDPAMLLRGGVSTDINGRDRAGGFLEGTWRLSDQWSIQGTTELTARDTPLAAARVGIWSDAVGLGVLWRQDDLREAEATIRAMRFSDDNTRLIGFLRWQERVLNRHDWKLDLQPYAYVTSNTRDDAPYFNPDRDAEVALTATLTWIAWGRWEESLRVRGSVTAGGYWQQGFGWSPVISARVENVHVLSETLNFSYGVGWTRRSYDGDEQDGFFGIAALRWRF